MKFSNEKPPIYDRLHEKFGVEFKNGIAIAYGDTVHCVNNLTTDMEVHEKVHFVQQAKVGLQEWWNKYIDDPGFRLAQELEAYRAQYKYLIGYAPKNYTYGRLQEIAKDLSGPMYGSMMSFEEAKQAIIQ